MKFKKMYIEITNKCNLSCDFCIKNSRKCDEISNEKFEFLLNKIKSYTKYLYFHILGEPLMHSNINELIDKAHNSFFVNITTNGYLIDKIKENKNITQLNISLHSFNEKYKITLEEYLNNIFNSIDTLILNNTYIYLRLWVKSKYKNEIVNIINKKYNVNIKNENYKINDNLFINYDQEFIWPDLNNNYYNELGTCYGLIEQLGILVDGTIVPCCLDTKGSINLGNIYQENLDEILNKEICKKVKTGFKNNTKILELCKHCNFIDRKKQH